MELYPNFEDDQFNAGFSPEIDYFDLSDFGKRLTNLLLNLQAGSSLVLDGQWGSGKTHFAKMLRGHLKAKGVPVVYFNAFEHDHMSVPFEAICSAITKATNENIEHPEAARNKFLKVAGRVGKGVALTAGRIGVRLATAGVLDLTDLGLVEDNADEIADVIDDRVEKSVQAAILSGAVAERTLIEFRAELSELRSTLSGQSEVPLVIIIDELDRCRPDFSIGILESIKHFFGIPKVHFLLVTNLDQMNGYANHLYGTGDQSSEYLSKFYDVPIPFPPRLTQQHRSRQSIIVKKYFTDAMAQYFDQHVLSHAEDVIISIVNFHQTSLRDTYKICASTRLGLLALGQNHGGSGYLIAPLCAMKYLLPSAYKKILAGKLDPSDLDVFFGTPDPDDDDNRHHTKQVFRYHTVDAETLQTGEFSKFKNSRLGIRLGRTETLPWVIHNFIEAFKIPDSDPK